MRPESRQLIEQLISFDSVSRHSNLPLLEFIQEYLDEHGVDSQLIYNDDRSKANLLACIGPKVAGGVVLSGHSDVVPVDGQDWSTEPFTLTEKDGRLYGRGTADMKSFIALALAAVPALRQAPIKRPVYLAFSYDEEIGCLGAPRLIEQLKADYPQPLAVIVGEPTSMQAVVAHKSITTLRTHITGHEAHSSQVQRGVSAVTLAARLISFIDDMMQENQAAADSESPFIPPYTTLHTGVIQGGTAVNIISRHCQFDWDIRCLPGDDWQAYLQRFNDYAEQLLAPLREIAPDIGIATEIIAEVPAFDNPSGGARALLSHLNPAFKPQVVPFVSEAGQFQQAGFDTILCGPGSIDQAHQPDEYITIEQIREAEVFFDRLIHFLCAPSQLDRHLQDGDNTDL